MLKIDRNDQSLSTLASPSLADVSISERYDLQEFISNSPDAFFKEIGQELFLIGKELEPSTTVADRIDLLAIDKDGTCVIIELKRGSNKLQMFQAITYAGMISQWNSEDLLQPLDEEQQDALIDFLDVEAEEINRRQRIILVAEGYDYALLAGADWLAIQHNVDVICCRIAIAKDSVTDAEYLSCSNVYPAPELAQEAVKRGGRRESRSANPKWTDWDSALANIPNQNIVAFFKQELAANREAYLLKRILRYRFLGKRRWNLTARNNIAYGWQQGRFEGDIAFWQQRLGQPDEVKPVKRLTCLRFYLQSEEDFRAFHDVAIDESLDIQWS